MYDANGNLTGLSERRTTDATGADGFSAILADGPTRAYGMVYDASNRLIFAQRYDDDQRTGEWGITQDATGNLRSINDRISGNVLAITLRDAAHRIIQFSSPGFVANPYYDARGRLIGFNYFEDASPSNGNAKRALKINYIYAADGTLTARTGTVSTNLGQTCQSMMMRLISGSKTWNPACSQPRRRQSFSVASRVWGSSRRLHCSRYVLNAPCMPALALRG